MGYSRWDSNDYRSFASTSAATLSAARSCGMSDSMARKQVFKQTTIKPIFDPKGVMLRESRDSEVNPNSNAIILGLDVTGSMGIVAEKIATEGLGKLVDGILTRKPVDDPHVMVMAIGDAFCDLAPLQVSQFEADIRIAEQLKELWLEGGGGGNAFESYDIPWYFAGKRTAIDCFEKRGKKGYLFTIGDEPPPPQGLTSQQINSIFNGGEEKSYSSEEMLELAQEKYNVFHIICEQGSHCSYNQSRDNTIAKWRNLLGKKAILLSDYDYISEVIISVMEVNEGADPESVINSWEKIDAKNAVRHALGL